MERDTELALSRELAGLQATLVGFAKDTARRLDRIEEQTTKTNGRVDKLEQVTAVQAGVQQALAEAQQHSKAATVVVGTEVVTLSNFKWWLAIAIGCFCAGAGFAALVGWSS